MRTAIALSVLLVGASPGQETPKESTQPEIADHMQRGDEK